MRKALLLLAVFAVAATPAIADDEVRKPFAASIQRGTLTRVLVDVAAGEIDIRNGDSKTIAIRGELRREYGSDRDRAKQAAILDAITPIITVNGDEAIIEGKFGPNAKNWSARTFRTEWRLTVEIPRGMDVEIATRYGELTIDGEFANLVADLRAGEIDFRTPRATGRELNASVRIGEVHADLGDERVSNEGILPGSTHFYNSGGKSRYKLHTTVGELRVRLTR
jgi:hypothetical protein